MMTSPLYGLKTAAEWSFLPPGLLPKNVSSISRQEIRSVQRPWLICLIYLYACSVLQVVKEYS